MDHVVYLCCLAPAALLPKPSLLFFAAGRFLLELGGNNAIIGEWLKGQMN